MKSVKYANLNLMYKNKIFKINLEASEDGKVNISELSYNDFNRSVRVCIGSIIGEYQLVELKDKESDIANAVTTEIVKKLFPLINDKITYLNSEVMENLLLSIKSASFDYYCVEGYYA